MSVFMERAAQARQLARDEGVYADVYGCRASHQEVVALLLDVIDHGGVLGWGDAVRDHGRRVLAVALWSTELLHRWSPVGQELRVEVYLP